MAELGTQNGKQGSINLPRQEERPELPSVAQRVRLVRFTLLTLALATCLGVGLTMELVRIASETERSRLLELAITASSAFDPAKLVLSAESNPDGIKKQIQTIRSLDQGFAAVHLAVKAQGHEISWSTEEHQTKPVRLANNPAAELLAQSSAPRIPSVQGPLRDARGEWVSAYVPIKEPIGGGTVGFLVIDTNADQWRSHIARYAWLGVALTATAFLLVLTMTSHSWRLLRLNAALTNERIQRYEQNRIGLVASKRKYYSIAQELEAACQQIEADRIELREANARLLASEEKHRKLTENLSDVVTIIGVDGVISYESPSVLKVLGYTPEERVNTNIFTFVHPDDREEIIALFRQGLETPGFIDKVEARYRHKNGSWRVLEACTNNVLDDPVLNGVIITSRDITERLQAVKTARTTQKMLENVLEAIPVSVFWKDRDLAYAGCNSRFLRDAGLNSPTQLMGRKDSELPWPGGIGPCHGIDAEVLDSGEPHIGAEEPWETARGIISIRRNIVTLKDSAGEVVGVLGTMEDISKQRLLETQLRQAQRLEALGTLAGGIAHDFNNILGAILGYAELALDDIPAETRARGFIQEVLIGGRRAAALVRQILAFSRKHESERKAIRLTQVVEETVRLVRETLPHTISMHHRIDPEVPPVMADPSQLAQMLANLCTNAVEAMKDSGGRLAISLGRVRIGEKSIQNNMGLRPGVYACLSVEDTGCGMNDETKSRLFDPYFTTKADPTGSGLGLAAVHGIVKSHKGAIDVSTKPGVGTHMRVFLPVADDKRECPPRRTPLATASGEHILLVDDDELVLNATKAILERMQYRVTAVDSPAQALQHFHASPDAFDLVLTDNTMPGISGVTLAETILETRPGFPIVLLTGRDEPEVRDIASITGIYATLGKPARIDKLGRTVREAIESRKCFQLD